jgi:hypothetical protein
MNYKVIADSLKKSLIIRNKILLSAVAAISMTTASMAQSVPNYLPTNGLVGWWPFNGNANDESGNGNNGTLIGSPALTTDRFGNQNQAYSFNNTHNYINCGNGSSLNFNGPFTMSAWVKTASNYSNCGILGRWNNAPGSYEHYLLYLSLGKVTGAVGLPNTYANATFNFFDNMWHLYNILYDGISVKVYIDGTLASQQLFSGTLNNVSQDFLIASYSLNAAQAFVGEMDDISIYNRALTQTEITNLYNAPNCANNTAITPQISSLAIGNTAIFTASTSDPNPSYVWQSDLGQGFQTLNNYGNYSGTTTTTLTLSNVQLTNHLQPFRVIATAGNCVDTSATAFIQITDTCVNTVIDTNYVTVTDTNYVTVYDTVTTYISVTDTLFIDINTVGLNNNPVVNTIKVFPNPSNSILNLNYGNYATLNNYRVKITNALGQTIYDQAITQQSETIDLSTFGGNGIYYLSILNPQGNVVEVRKIVLQ